MITWSPAVCSCELNLNVEASKIEEVKRVCEFHETLTGDLVAMLEALRSECVKMSSFIKAAEEVAAVRGANEKKPEEYVGMFAQAIPTRNSSKELIPVLNHDKASHQDIQEIDTKTAQLEADWHAAYALEKAKL